eukprot:13969442-Ditylum_brightwellii.AAC.1
MMIRFSGRLNETHCMKNKPIREEYKFFTLTTTDGVLVNLTPDRISTTKSGRQEYEVNKTQ